MSEPRGDSYQLLVHVMFTVKCNFQIKNNIRRYWGDYKGKMVGTIENKIT